MTGGRGGGGGGRGRRVKRVCGARFKDRSNGRV